MINGTRIYIWIFIGILVFVQFWGTKQERTADYISSLPFRRGEVYWTKVISGIVSVTIPFLLFAGEMAVVHTVYFPKEIQRDLVSPFYKATYYGDSLGLILQQIFMVYLFVIFAYSVFVLMETLVHYNAFAVILGFDGTEGEGNDLLKAVCVRNGVTIMFMKNGEYAISIGNSSVYYPSNILAYVQKNIKDGFYCVEASVGGIRDEMILFNSEGEQNNPYHKMIRVRLNHGKTDQVKICMQKPKSIKTKCVIAFYEVDTLANILSDLAGTREEAVTFLQKLSLADGKEGKLGSATWKVESEDNGTSGMESYSITVE